MNEIELVKQWEAEEALTFEGWDFSHLKGRWDSSEPAWDYNSVTMSPSSGSPISNLVETPDITAMHGIGQKNSCLKEIINSYLKPTDTLLDMGTGGGEFLLTLGHPYNKTFATEAYEPNFKLCMKTLAPLGITVKQTYTDENLNADDKLPFDDEFFDVIINRHESFDLEEVSRTLKQGGYFITQQVGNQSNRELMYRLNDNNAPYMPQHTLERYVETLVSLGFQIIKTDETVYPTKIFDVGALVYYAKIIIWEFPGFSVQTHLDKLLDFQNDINKKGYIETTDHRFLIAAKKRENS